MQCVIGPAALVKGTTVRIIAASVFLLLLTMAPASAAGEDPHWPHEISKPGGKLVVYQPQVDDWENFQQLDARMAFTIAPTGGKAHVGAATVRWHTAVNMDDHTVFLDHPEITSLAFPSLDPATTTQMDQLARTFLNPASTMTISLDRLVASAKKTKEPPVAPVKNDPPTIFLSMRPAVLLLVNGAPVLAPIPDSNLQFVVNANWPLFVEQGSSTYYLFDGKGWLSSNGLQATWTPTSQLPKQMSKVPSNPNFTDLKAFIPAPPDGTTNVPIVYYSATPAEIVIFDGQPHWTLIPGTQLSYASNTSSTVLKYAPTGAFYYLTSGRWFTTTTPVLGGWAFATYTLPPDFAHIPPDNPEGKVLASVPGTPEAEDAVLIAQIPTTVAVNAAEAAKEVKVSYVGEPQFQPIEGTTIKYATNTPNKVIEVAPKYYLCYQGVWFVSSLPQGPWVTAQTVPQVIYTIPPSSPVYNVTYVTQVSSSNGNVTSSYTAGYMGMFVAGATVGAIVASGTGYYYPPYVYSGYYYPYAATYGYRTYNPYTGAYGYGATAYGPYGSTSWGTSYNPNTGTYARGASQTSAYGSRGVAEAYNPYTGAYGATRQASNAYGSWGQSVVTKNGNTAYTQHASNAYGSAGTVQTSAGGRGAATSTAYGNTAAGKTASGDMYAGHDGNVYKNTGSGWQTYDNGTWTNVQKPTTTSAQNYSQTQPPSSNPNYTSAQQKAQSNPNYTSAQQKAQSNPNYSSAQQKAQSNPNYASAQQKAQTNNQQRPSGGSGLASSGGSSLNSLQQEAQNRQRGTQQSQRFSQYQHSAGGSGGTRSSGGRR